MFTFACSTSVVHGLPWNQRSCFFIEHCDCRASQRVMHALWLHTHQNRLGRSFISPTIPFQLAGTPLLFSHSKLVLNEETSIAGGISLTGEIAIDARNMQPHLSQRGEANLCCTFLRRGCVTTHGFCQYGCRSSDVPQNPWTLHRVAQNVKCEEAIQHCHCYSSTRCRS